MTFDEFIRRFLKTIFGGRLKNRNIENQKSEVRLRCKLLNKFSTFGLPKRAKGIIRAKTLCDNAN